MALTITRGKTKDSLVVRGLEEQVRDIRTKMEFLRDLERQVDAGKKTLRDIARATAEGAGQLTGKIEFVDDRGGAIAVSLPDPDATGNRLGLSEGREALLAELQPEGFVWTEVVETVVLEGSWIEWLRGCMETWKTQGLTSFLGITFRRSVRLTADGVRAVMALAATGQNEGASQLLEGGFKAASVALR